MAARKDFKLFRGTAPTLRIGPIRNVDGELVDIDGRPALFTMRAYATDADAVFTKVGAGQPGSYITIPLTRTETLSLAPGDYAYAVAMTDQPEDLTTLGVVRVAPDITNAVAT